MSVTWPNSMNVAQVRISRPTDRLPEVVEFYSTNLGLVVLEHFEQHDGWDGVMLGLPGTDYHLEFTHHNDGTPCPAPTRENVLVLYLADEANVQAAAERMASAGHPPVELDNPWWASHGGVGFEDPDGWRIIFMPSGDF